LLIGKKVRQPPEYHVNGICLNRGGTITTEYRLLQKAIKPLKPYSRLDSTSLLKCGTLKRTTVPTMVIITSGSIKAPL